MMKQKTNEKRTVKNNDTCIKMKSQRSTTIHSGKCKNHKNTVVFGV